MNELEDELSRITGLSRAERQSALRWFARQSEEARVRLMKDRFKLFRSLRAIKKLSKPTTLDYAAIVLAAKGNGFLAEKKYRSKRVPTARELEVIAARRAERARAQKRIPKKREKVARKWGVVVELRRQGISFAGIAKYLSREHQIKVTRQYVYRLYSEWELL